MAKKSWETPVLTAYGVIEQLTQIQMEKNVQLGQFITPNFGIGLMTSDF